jgi:hypothetical protein
MDIVAIATGVATPAGAGEIRQDPAAADVVAPSRQPLPADSDQDELIPAGVLASDPAPAEPSIGPAIGEPAYEADIAPANFPNSPADGRSLGNQGEQTTAPGLPKAMAAVGAVDTTPGGTATAMSAHLARIRERYPDGPRQQDVVTKSAHRAEAARPVLVDTTLGDAPVTQKVGSTIIIQDDELVAIKLSELISLFETRLDRSLFVWMRTASAASKFVTADTLASAGIEAHYDSTSRQLVLSVNSE